MRRIRTLSLLAALAGLLLLGGSYRAHEALANDPVNLAVTEVEEQVGSMLITLNATGPDGRPLNNLSAPNFRVFLDDQPLSVRQVQRTDGGRQAASIVALVDVSGSMWGEPMEQARAALRLFISQLEREDRVAIMSFGTDIVLLQDFTTDRAALDRTAAGLQVFGDTALYDAVLAAVAALQREPAERRLIVLLSDGEANINVQKRQESLDAAVAAGVGVMSIGLGQLIDPVYLAELSDVSGGLYTEVVTPAELRQAYSELAVALRSRYVLNVSVPASVNRTVPGTLRVQATLRGNIGNTHYELAPLEGALPPTFHMTVSGVRPGQRLTGAVEVAAVPADGRELVQVEYLLNGELLHAAEGEVLPFEFRAQGLEPGNHTLTLVATDAFGARGEAQVPFIVPPPPPAASGGGLGGVLVRLGGLALLVAVAAAIVLNLRKRRAARPDYVLRIKRWDGREALAPRKTIDDLKKDAAAGEAQELTQALGAVIVAHEAALRSGAPSAARRFDLYTSPMTIGTREGSDIRLEDRHGQIADEEARIWVQKRRLVYHKLSSLGALAPESMSEGWHFLEDGEEIRVGDYRLRFESAVPEAQTAPPPGEPAQGSSSGAQEHGMSLGPGWRAASEG